MPVHCIEQYIAEVEVSILGETLKKYKDLIDDGYDGKFKTYERYVKDQVPLQINAFMASKKVHQYFKCTDTGTFYCCKDCNYATCHENCQKFDGCKSGDQTLDIKCPQEQFKLDMLDSRYIPAATFSLQDKNGFWKDIGDEYGIDESWVEFGRRNMRTGNGCQYAGKDIKGCIDKADTWWYNYPNANQDKIKVYNPKDIFTKSKDQNSNLLENLEIVKDLNLYDTLMPWSDLVDAASLPALTSEAAITNMQKIINKANEIEKQEREEFILNMAMGILFFIPVVGEAGVAGLTAARSMLRLIGVAGDAGLTVYEMVKDPKNAFMAAFTYVLGAGVGRAGYRDAANSRRAIQPKQLNGLGTVKTDLRRIETSRKNICYI